VFARISDCKVATIALPNAWKIYDLIVRHFLANLMQPALFEKTRLEITVKDEIFDSTGSVQKDAGWLQVYPFETKNDKLLPLVEERRYRKWKMVIKAGKQKVVLMTFITFLRSSFWHLRKHQR